MSTVPDIKETGVRGFLLWLKAVQPGLYERVATNLPQKAPAAFADYHAGAWQVAGLSGNAAMAKMQAIYEGRPYSQRQPFPSGMGDFSSSEMLPEITVSGNFISDPISSDVFSGVPQVSDTAGTLLAATPGTVAIDTAQAANTGVTSSSVVNTIGSLVGAATSTFLTVSQQNNVNKAVQTNLTRAQQGLPPLPLPLLGIPTIPGVGAAPGGFFASASASPIFLLALAAGAYFLFSGGSKKPATP